MITSTGTHNRLAGADRYETAALLSYYLTAGPDGKNNGQLSGQGRVYVASGNDANIVDAMVAGQLEKGPILLLPSTGNPSDNVLAEFKRLGMTQGHTMKEGFTIGGTNAVSDDTLKAAVKSFAEGLKDQPESAPAAPAASATPTGVTITADGSAANTFKVSATAPDGGTLTYKWTISSGTATIDGSDTGASVKLSAAGTGQTLTVVVTNTKGSLTPATETKTKSL